MIDECCTKLGKERGVEIFRGTYNHITVAISIDVTCTGYTSPKLSTSSLT